MTPIQPVGPGEEAQEVRGQGCAEAVRLLRADVRGGQGGGDDGVAGEGHRAFQTPGQRRQHAEPTVEEVAEQRVRFL